MSAKHVAAGKLGGAPRKARDRVGPNGDERQCLACGHWKSLDAEFPIDRSGTKGRRARCKGCFNSRQRGQREVEKTQPESPCETCLGMPWRRPLPVCDCGEKFRPEEITRPDVSLVGAQLANAWEGD